MLSVVFVQLVVARKAEEKAGERVQWPGVGTEKTQQTVAQRIGFAGQASAGNTTG